MIRTTTLFFLLFFIIGINTSFSQTFTVNSLGDAGDSNTGDLICDDGTGNCTFRAAIEQANASGATLIDFSVSGTLVPGSIYILNASNTTIDGGGNIIVDASGVADGIRLQGANITVDNMTFSNAWAAGIFGSASATILNCTLSNNDGNGINNGFGGTVDNCTIVFNGGDGIIMSAISTIINCDINNNVFDGIRIGGDFTIQDNFINNNTEGINVAIAGAGGTISSNYINDNSANGVNIVATASAHVTQNSFSCNGGAAISSLPGNPTNANFYVATTQDITGTTCNNCEVELYENHVDACIDCEGETYLQTVIADGTGWFHFSGSFLDGTKYDILPYESFNDNTGEFTCLTACTAATNDYCSGSIVLSDGVTTNSDLACSTNLNNEMGCLWQNTVWFEYTTSSTVSHFSVYTELEALGINFGIEIYDACGGNTLLSSCFFYVSGTVNLFCVEPNTTYYIQIGANSADLFDIVVNEFGPPNENDTCNNATDEGTLNSCVWASIAGSTWQACSDNIPGLTCTADSTVWHQITLPSGAVGIEFFSIPTGFELVLWDDCPGLGTALSSCISSAGTVTSLSAGTYYISVSGATGGYSFLYYVSVPPSNDLCSNAISMALNSSQSVDSSCSSADGFSGIGANCSPHSESSVWYSFTTGPTTAQVSFQIPEAGGMTPFFIEVYDDCLMSQLMDSECDIISSAAWISSACFSPNTTYYVQVASEFPATYTLTINDATVANEFCEGATTTWNLDCAGLIGVSGALGNCADEEATGGGCMVDVAGGWIQITVDPLVSEFQITNAFGNYELFEGPDCDNLSSLGSCATGTYTNNGDNFYLLVDQSPSTLLDIVATCCAVPPSNDMCAGAISLVMGGAAITEDNSCATADGLENNCINGENSLWYTFTTGPDQYQIGIFHNQPFFNVAWELYTDCPGTDIVGNFCPGGTSFKECLLPNTTYYLQFSTSTANSGPFTLFIADATPPWEKCHLALDQGTIDCDGISTAYGDVAESDGFCIENGFCEVSTWQFITVGTGVTELYTEWGSSDEVVIYKGDCSNLDEFTVGSNGSCNYNAMTTFNVSEGDVIYFQSGYYGIMQLEAFCCNLIINVTTPATCDDNGTPSDDSDDTFSFDITVSGTNMGAGVSWTTTDGLVSGDYTGTVVTFGPFPISGGAVTIEIEDDVNDYCFDMVTVSPPAMTCSPDCEITSAIITDILCDDSGTPSDATDDTFSFNVEVDGFNLAATWTADDPNSTTGTYNTIVPFGPYDISAGDFIFNIEDDGGTPCLFIASATAPPTCSDLCAITNVVVTNVICDDNGTSSDASDDTFTFDVEAFGLNVSTWSATDPNTTSGAYSTIVNFGPYDISGGDLIFVLADDNDPACTFDLTVSPPATCSPDCEITDAVISNYVCDDNGTPSDSSDDTFTFEVNATGFNLDPNGWSANDPNNTSGFYNTQVVFGPYDFIDGDLNFDVTDITDLACSFNIDLVATSCSDLCDIDHVVTNIQCNDNGTPGDPDDDTFTFDVEVTGFNVGFSWYGNDPNATIGAYDSPTSFGPFDISAGDLNFTITDDTDIACTTNVMVVAPAPCSNSCSISYVVNNIICDPNGTPSDDSDDTFTFELIVTGSNAGASWTADDPNSTTGSYGVAVTFGPYNISAGDLNFTLTDIADTGCTESVMISAPSACSSSCSISNSVTNIVCDDNGTPTDNNDDTFSFDIEINGSNVGAGWTADDPLGSSGMYSTIITLGPYPISGGDLNFTVTDDTDGTCTTAVTVAVPGACSNVCSIMNVVSNIQCNNGGTPSDPSDDTFSFDVTITGSNTATSWTADDPNLTSGSYGVVSFGPYAISSGDLNFTITDGVDATCTTMVAVSAPATCSNDCAISHTINNIVCDDNGSLSDDTDDTFTFDIIVSGSNNGLSWTAGDPNATTGGYGPTISFGPYPISGGDLNFDIVDVDDSACITSVIAAAPNPCSSSCSISNIVSNIVCNDGGTPANPNDDTFSFDVVVTGSNTASSWSADDPNGTSGSYGNTIPFGPYPISGGDLSFTITDGVDGTCTTPVTVVAPNTCSNLCEVITLVNNIVCNNNGTPTDDSDDTFTFDVNVAGSNTGASWIGLDPNGTTGTYNMTINFGPYPISGGDLNFDITDVDDPTCLSNVMVAAPNACSTSCSITNNVTNIQCDNNGTPTDDTDDTFTFDVEVTGSNTAITWTADDPNSTTGAYNSVIPFGPYPIGGGGDLIFTITDFVDTGCATMVTVTPPVPCSSPVCNISHTVTNIQCDNNGTPTDDSDDTFTFDVEVNGTLNGPSWAADDPNATVGLYDVTIPFGPYDISTGNLNFTITDSSNSTCSTIVMVTAPNACSTSCSISNNVTNIQCDDNGTPTDDTDDTFTFDVEVLGANNGASWTADDPNLTTGGYNTTILFGPYPIGGGADLNFTITDIDNIGCSTAVNVTPPMPCSTSGSCSISNSVTNIQCDNNGTPTDDTDDLFTLDVVVTGSMNGATWTADDPNSETGAYDTTIPFGPYPIGGGADLNFTITDIDDGGCTTAVNVTPPTACSTLCSISNNVTNVQCDDNGTSADDTDDTFTFDVVVSGSNTGASWTSNDPNATIGIYDATISFGPYNIGSGAVLDFTITDIGNAGCTTMVSVTPPAPCSDACNIMAVVSNLQCDDNGTALESDDTYTFELNVTGMNLGASWTANDPNVTTGVYATQVIMGPYLISNGDLIFNITDVLDATCTTLVNVVAPQPCSNCMNANPDTDIEIEICSEDKYLYNGIEYEGDMLYQITLIDQDGCDSIINLDVINYPDSDIMFIDTVGCAGFEFTYEDIVFDEFNSSQEITFPDANEYGCDSMAIVTVDFVESGADCPINFIVTPTKTMTIDDLNEDVHSIAFFGRWGIKVFEIIDPEQSAIWDGRGFNGQLLPEGTYYFIVFTKNEDGGLAKDSTIKQGFITLLN